LVSASLRYPVPNEINADLRRVIGKEAGDRVTNHLSERLAR